ncbi:MAG: 16S rRNA (cytosine(1402)-N(4))-methyltransferase RsmH [Synergistales bacterium]|nr:16S rRNA (cytosine(1402)-N(4))-methyltransferase RsmH [Synergistales bacterium]
MSIEHIPVLLEEVLSALRQQEPLTAVVDATLGLGGHSEAILQHFPSARVLGIDQDSEALSCARKRLEPFGARCTTEEGNFRAIKDILERHHIVEPHAVLLDLGVSSLQLRSGERGFSYNVSGPLDMRMAARQEDIPPASEVINSWSAKELERLFRIYGEERYARDIARCIVKHRKHSGAISTTDEFVGMLRKQLPAPIQRTMGRHPARKVFQALRIYVNDELNSLETFLQALREMALRNCTTVIISYHSLEDRMVKHTFRSWKQAELGSVITKKPIVPKEDEVQANYSARSAKMRVFRFRGKGE